MPSTSTASFGGVDVGLNGVGISTGTEDPAAAAAKAAQERALAYQRDYASRRSSAASGTESFGVPGVGVGAGGSVAAGDADVGGDGDGDSELGDNALDYGPCARKQRDGGGYLPSSPAIICCPCGTSTGNVLFLYRSERLPRVFPFTCAIGPDWPCLCITFGLILAPSIAFFVFVAPEVHVAVLVLGILTMLGLIGALTVTAASDPGVVPKQSRAALQRARAAVVAEAEARDGPGAGQAALGEYTICSRCNVLRKAGTHHCYDCDACIEELDHHCPWTGKCIGEAGTRGG